MFNAILTYTVVISVMIYSILLLNYCNQLIKAKLENKSEIQNCKLTENVLATQGIAITLLFLSILALLMTMHIYNPAELEIIIDLGTKIPVTKYIVLALTLGLSIYIFVNTKQNAGCADKIKLHSSLLDTLNITIMVMISLYGSYEGYRIYKGTDSSK